MDRILFNEHNWSSSRYGHTSPHAKAMLSCVEATKVYAGSAGSEMGNPDAIEPTNCANQSPTSFASGNLPAEASIPSASSTADVSEQVPDFAHVFEELARMFGFQHDVVANAREHFLSLYRSRASRMESYRALATLHEDYICGDYANYRRWIFSPGLNGLDCGDAVDMENADGGVSWSERMRTLSIKVLVILDFASNIRLMPEVLCFIFYLADAYHCRYTDTEFEVAPPGKFLEDVITPLYEFLRDQNWKLINGILVQKEKDHSRIITYDDINEFFWSLESIATLTLKDHTKLSSIPLPDRYSRLKEINWKKAFRKTFIEYRSLLHLIVNFSRIWILHLGFFYSYLALSLAPVYAPGVEDKHRLAASPNGRLYPRAVGSPWPRNSHHGIDESAAKNVQWSIVGLGGAFSILFAITATMSEACFLPHRRRRSMQIGGRLLFLLCLLVLNLGPAAFVLFVSKAGKAAEILSTLQLVVSAGTLVTLAIVPPVNLTFKMILRRRRQGNVTRGDWSDFAINIAPLKPGEKWLSIVIWAVVFVSKLIESLLFLVLPAGKPIRVLLDMPIATQCHGFVLLCQITVYSSIVLFLLLLLCGQHSWASYVLYVPESRMYVKLFAIGDMSVKQRPKTLCAQLWNGIIICMAQEHLISLKQLDKLLYRQHILNDDSAGFSTSGADSVNNMVDAVKSRIEKPRFFTAQEDVSTKMEYLSPGSEAKRRITFFAQSLSTTFPEPTSVFKMPAFCVLTPHFNEKILLSLREIIREDDSSSSITILEYLKCLHPEEWANFVDETKLASQASSCSYSESGRESCRSDIPLRAVGFRDHTPEGHLRTRIWASLRSQTLYRTVSGFMNYAKALKLLLRIEHQEIGLRHGNQSDLESELDAIVSSKFQFVVAMQRLSSFNSAEKSDLELLFQMYPELKVGYLDCIDGKHYSVLIDGKCPFDNNGARLPRFKVQLPGPPILGDGKADNQNQNIIWTRGEFLQLIDANQDNYLEEAIKIRSMLQEFEVSARTPVAIVGTREFIFSERIGVLGDVAAGKEYAFGTISQRVTAKLGGRLHYGHPDFLNAIFMTTRGGASKAQKGLSVNEDIFAGMTAMLRGGRIKHTEYMQCGKGRDLGFSSILKFVAKIGAGMGEQMLSREHYYLGLFLPMDRLLTFYYGHPGFHVNNIFIMFSIQLFLLLLLNLASFNVSLVKCLPRLSNEDPLRPSGCVDIDSLLEWIRQAVFAIVVIFMVTFLPLFLQILTEQGILTALSRISKQILSLSPLFDVFTTQICKRIDTNGV
ncbi:1,3-beta-D-glucan synthase [Irineochytrium annulatum]|nr:1,3-beta-D-glucan synthase [Irineochytrium annulatum]